MKAREIVLAGGAGGIGSAVLDLLYAEGLQGERPSLVASFRANAARAEESRRRAEIVQADITIAADRTRLLDAAPYLYGLVVLAGDPARPSPEIPIEETMRRSHEVNYLGPLLLAREAAERMKAAAQPGAIVLVSTMQAVALFPGSTAYAAPKAALIHAARILAKEMRGSNIRVNVVSPGVTAAGMARESIASGKYDRLDRKSVV